MWNTWDDVKDDVPVEHIADWVATVADGAPDRHLRVVVMTAHGQGGWIALGQGIVRPRGPQKIMSRDRGIDIHDVPVFAKWMNKVANIWIIACSTAYKMPDREYDGGRFCSALAKTTGAYVVASTDQQMGDILPLPWGCVDRWEGVVRRYEPEHGSVDWQHEFVADYLSLGKPEVLDTTVPPIAIPPRLRALVRPGALWREAPKPPKPDPLRFPMPTRRFPGPW